MIRFTVPGVPVAKARARVSTQGGFARAYTPKKSADYESLVRLHAQQAMFWSDRKPMEGPLDLVLAIFMPVPASWSKRKRADALSGALCHLVKPDASNILKSVEDAMNGVVYADDSQIVSLRITKCYSDEPRVEVSIAQKTVFDRCG